MVRRSLTTNGRQQERGAAVFIVVMVVTLLTAVGIFAARSASLVDTASGYNRQSLQTEYVADYGVMLTASELSTEALSAYTSVAQQGTDDRAGERQHVRAREGGVVVRDRRAGGGDGAGRGDPAGAAGRLHGD